jgi:ADP-heptose:LPS heptosyltransferase
VQFVHKNSRRKLNGVTLLDFQNFRDAISVLSKADIYVGPEGGMHHAAAAVGVKAVVLMGGFIPPAVVGYDSHVSLTGGAEACGNIEPCVHCRAAMKKITVEQVMDAVNRLLLEEGTSDGSRRQQT